MFFIVLIAKRSEGGLHYENSRRQWHHFINIKGRPPTKIACPHSVEFKTSAAIRLLFARGADNGFAKFRYRQIVVGAA